MKKYIILAIVTLSLSAWGQAWTNLSATLQNIYTNMPAPVQVSTADTWSDYQKAVRLSPEFQGIVTNVVTTVISDTNGVPTGTNTVSTITTNHSSMSFTLWFVSGLQREKVSRVIEQRNQEMREEMYRKVGQTIVNAWQ
jgi:hypothetical protein